MPVCESLVEFLNSCRERLQATRRLCLRLFTILGASSTLSDINRPPGALKIALIFSPILDVMERCGSIVDSRIP
jgi:hypothetical protein